MAKLVFVMSLKFGNFQGQRTKNYKKTVIGPIFLRTLLKKCVFKQQQKK